MPGTRLFDVRAALAALTALGLAGLAALAMAIVTHLPAQTASAPAPTSAQASGAGLSRLQALPLQAQSVISSTVAADSRAFAARRTGSGWGLSGGGVRADFGRGEPTLRLAGDSTLSLSLAGFGAPGAVTAHGNRVTLAHSGISEWYAAGPLGIEQGFTLAHRPAGAESGGNELTLALAVGGSLRAVAAGSTVNFMGSRGDIAARYGGLTAVDATGRHLPSALSVVGGRVVISVNDRGARYPLTIDPLVQQGGKLVPSDIAPGISGSQFGSSVAISADGNTALIGAQIDNSSTGAAWVFTRSSGVWTQLGPKILPTNGNSQFGTSAALSADGSTALVGGELDNSQTGAAWVYVRSGSSYAEQFELLGNGEVGSSIRFGHSVSLSADGNTALVGGPDDQGTGNAGVSGGSAWVFVRSGTTWSQQGPKLSPVLAPNATNQSAFGTAVALSADGNTAFIGGPQDGPGVGAVEVYTRSGSTWSSQQKLNANDEAGSPGTAQFGSAIDLSADGTTAIIGGPDDNNSTGGAAWIFVHSGATWTQQGPKLVPANGNGPAAEVGSSVAISANGNTALIGSASDSNMVGAAYLFTRSGTTWTEQQRLTGTGQTGSAFFGTGVALSSDGQTAMIGAPGDTQLTGAAFAFAPPSPVCSSVSATAPQGGGSVAVSLSCILPSGASPGYAVIGGPSNGSVSAVSSTGLLTYTSHALFSGQDSFTYRVSDQWGSSNIATATVTVPFLPVPTCSNVTTKGKAGATKLTVTLKCTGPKGHSFSYGIVSKPGNGKLGKINQSNGKVTYTTHIGAQGTDRFVYNANNAGGSSKTATATIKLPKLQRITTGLNWNFQPTAATFTQINSLSILALPGGAKATLTCVGKGKSGCPISKHTVSVPKQRICKGKGKKRKCKRQEPKSAFVNLTRFVSGRHLRVGTKMTLTMFEPGWIGKRYVFPIVANHQPPDTITEMAPGSPTRTCPQC
jgi:hypothetical protein